MCVKLSPIDLNPIPCPPHPTRNYTHPLVYVQWDVPVSNKCFFSKINKQININIILSANGLDKNNNTFSMKKQIILKIKM